MKTLIGNQSAVTLILIASAAILLFLFWLVYFHETPIEGSSIDLTILPALNALLNLMSATCLIFGFKAIRRGNRVRHKKMMLSALFFSFLFLVSYLTYHAFHGDTLFQGEGWVRPAVFLYFDFAHYSFCGSFTAGSNHSLSLRQRGISPCIPKLPGLHYRSGCISQLQVYWFT